MNKIELVKRAAEISDFTQKDVMVALDAINQAIEEALVKGDTVKTGLFTHSVKDTKGRIGHNPKTGEKINIAPSKKIATKTSGALSKAVKGE
jgi:DNA-binding protein HU-beta